MGRYNPAMTMAGLANADISPCTDFGAIINYLTEYCSRAEKKSAKLSDLMKEVLSSVSDHKPMVSMTRKVMNKLIGKRDYFALTIYMFSSNNLRWVRMHSLV